MGSCISKCKPKNSTKKHQSKPKDDQCKCQCNNIEQNNNNATLVKDKLVISQAPISSPTKTSISSPLSPSISSPSTNSSCTKPSMSSSSSSNSSSCSFLYSASSLASSSSISTSKSDQSFSNDFLWSCVKENPQFLRPDYLPLKVMSNPRRVSLPTRYQNSGRKPNGLNGLTKPSPQRVVVRSPAQKRPRSNSPSNITRQKSFRRDSEVEPNRPISRSSRDLRPMSPSSSRRFNGERNMTSSMRRENSRRFNNGNGKSNNNLLGKREKEEVIKGVSSRIGELTVGDLVSSQNMDLMPIEDANNPHIALDCFIFL